MELIRVLLSFIIGSALGIGYAFFFMYERSRTLAHMHEQGAGFNNQKFSLSTFSMTVIRLAILMILFFFVLRSLAVNVMLLVISFLISFWSIVILKKV